MYATTPMKEAPPVALPEEPFNPPVNRERLSATQRVGEVVGLFFAGIFMAVFGSFFIYHQVTGTGFFTAKFGPTEMVFFYGPLVLSLAVPYMRALTGRRNPGRLMEALTNLFQFVAAIWLLSVFPFNFTHFADALPVTIRFAFAWVNNDVGIAALILAIVISPIVALVRAGQFVYHAGR